MAVWIYPGGLASTDFSDAETTSSWSPQTYLYGAAVTVPAGGGTAVQMSVKCRCSGAGTRNLKFGLYTSGGSLVAQSTATVSSTSQAWVDSGTISGSVSAGTYYVLVSSDTSGGVYALYGYDTSGTGSYATEDYATAMQSSETITTDDASKLYGVRLSFEATVPTAALTGTATSSITESDIVTGGKTVILTLTDDTWVAASAGAITYVGGQGAGFAGKTSETAVTFALTNGSASTPAAGDLVIVAYHVGSTADRALTISAATANGTPYTLIDAEQYQNDTYDSNLRVAYRFMPATPETSVYLSQTGNIADAGRYTIHVFRGVDTGTPLDVAAVPGGGTNTRIVNPASITPTTAGAWIYVVGGAAAAAGGTYTASYLTDFRAGSTADTNDSQIGAGYVTWTSGAYDPAAFSAGGTDTTNDSWTSMTVALRPALSTPFADQRANIRNGLDSAQSEAAGWDAKVKPNIPVANVVRTSNTVCTITLQAQSDYNITATETITATIPATAVAGGSAIVATPTFTVATAGAGYTITSTAGSATAAGVSATLLKSRVIAATAGSATAAGVSATLKRSYTVTASPGAITAAGVSATLLKSKLIAATAGAATVTGASATLLRSKLITASPGAATAAGVSATLTLAKNYSITSTAGAATVAGVEATLKRSRLITASPSAATAAGASATLSRSKVIAATAGSATAAGVAATLTRSYVVTATAASIAAAGVEGTLLHSRKITGTAGAATIAGVSATLLYGTVYKVEGSPASATVQGVAATIKRSYVVNGQVADASVVGVAATLSRNYVVTSTAGSATVAGVSADLTYTAAPSGYTITAYPASIDLTGAAATLTWSGESIGPATFVGAVGRGRRRVWVEIRDGQVYEASDEPEARKIVKTIKRKAVRKLRQAQRAGAPIPEVPKLDIIGQASFLPDLRRDLQNIEFDLVRLYERAAMQRLREQEDDDEEAILALSL